MARHCQYRPVRATGLEDCPSKNRPGLLPQAIIALLMDLLMDGSARSVIHRHRLARRIRERPLQKHILVQTDTARHGPEATHNPKVVGSIPTPATNKSPGQSRCSGLGFRRCRARLEHGYRDLTYRDLTVPELDSTGT